MADVTRPSGLQHQLFRALKNEAVARYIADRLEGVTEELGEHAAGVVGTVFAPRTTRRSENGTIITEIKIDLTGLNSIDDADDILGLASTTAYIGRNVVANNGVIYKIELICLETPASGDDDINVVSGSAENDALTAVTNAAVEINGGNQVAGIVTTQDSPSVTADYYLYLTGGTGNLDATYTAGQFIIRLYGHPILT